MEGGVEVRGGIVPSRKYRGKIWVGSRVAGERTVSR